MKLRYSYFPGNGVMSFFGWNMRISVPICHAGYLLWMFLGLYLVDGGVNMKSLLSGRSMGGWVMGNGDITLFFLAETEGDDMSEVHWVMNYWL